MKIVTTDGPPEIEFTLAELHDGVLLIDILVALGWARSKREARQFIKDGAVRLGPYKR